MKFDALPNDAAYQIFKYLQYDDLCRMKLLSRHWYDMSQYDELWKIQCKKYWLLDKKDDKKSWQETFKEYFVNFGRYVQVYPKIKGAWNKLENHLQIHAHEILNSLQSGISEQYLNALLTEYGIDSANLPNSLRLCYRIHGGQNTQSWTEPGLFGSKKHWSLQHYCSQQFQNPLSTKIRGWCSREGIQKPKYYTLPLSMCIVHQAEISIVLPGEQEPLSHGVPPSYSIVELVTAMYTPKHCQHLVAMTFEDWFVTYVDEVVAGVYPIDNGHILRYKKNPDFIARTGRITVCVCLPPADPNYIVAEDDEPYISFQYRITMSMDEDAPMSDTCQLKDRHWYITSFSDSSPDEVHGSGVVGEHPIMKPGASHTWISSTRFKYPGGTMDGHFTMIYVNDPYKQLEVKCPKFVMNVPQQYGKKFQPWRDQKWPNKLI